MQISVELLVQQLRHIPGIEVSVKYTDSMSFSAWAEFWLDTYKKGIVKDNSYDGTSRNPVEVHLIPYFGIRPLASITPADVQLYFKTLRGMLSLETQRKIRNALRAIYDTAVECGKCQHNPVTKSLRLVSDIPAATKSTWSAEEYAIAFKFALHHPQGLAIITLMETALSRSELLGLCWKDLSIKSQTLILQNGLVCQKNTTTGHYELVHDGLKNDYRKRTIPISPLLCGLLTLKPRTILVGGNQKKGGSPHKVQPKFIFHAPDGGPYDPRNWYRRVLIKFMNDLHEAHPEVHTLTTHELRHTRATLLKDGGIDLFSIARLLGHCDLNMLAKRYAHDNVETLRNTLGLNNNQV